MKPIEGQFPLPAPMACPHCGVAVKSVDPTEPGQGPPLTGRQKSVFICIHCDGTSMLDPTGLRAATDAELAYIAVDQASRRETIDAALRGKKERVQREGQGAS
jgi:hypothetical protein